MTIMTRTGPAPSVTPETEQFWNSAREGQLVIGHCNSCDQTHYYPRSICPFCQSDAELVKASGKGEIYSYSLMVKAEQPYAIAYVKLDEGPVIMTNIIETSQADIQIGARVVLSFQPSEGNGAPLPMFKVSD